MAQSPQRVTKNGLPLKAINYKKVPADEDAAFDRQTIPKGLLSRHNTKVGVWGKIVCDEGTVRLEFLDNSSEEAEVMIGAGEYGVVNPKQYHLVELLTADTRMHVEFYQLPDADKPKGSGFG